MDNSVYNKPLDNKLIEFIITVPEEDNVKKHFAAYGDFSTEKNQYVEKHIEDPVLENLYMERETEDGEIVRWVPTNVSFAGHKYNVYDAIYDVIGKLTMNNTNIEVIFVRDGIKEFVEQYTKEIAFEYKNHQVPKLCYEGLVGENELFFATDKFCYYHQAEVITMLSTETGEIIASDAFGEMGLYNSYNNVLKDEEKVLFGNVPKDFEPFED